MFLAAADPTDHVTDKILLKVGDTPVLTMHMVTITIVAILFVVAMTRAARAIQTGSERLRSLSDFQRYTQ